MQYVNGQKKYSRPNTFGLLSRILQAYVLVPQISRKFTIGATLECNFQRSSIWLIREICQEIFILNLYLIEKILPNLGNVGLLCASMLIVVKCQPGTVSFTADDTTDFSNLCFHES